MAKSICEKARKRLDETLKCPTLVEKDNVRRLVRHQILKSPPANSPGGDQTRRDDQRKNNIEILEEKHSAEVWDILEMLRSASDYDSEKSKTNGWKLKQDTDQLRVMYREGPQGAPFHTLLAEGYIDGPLENFCRCMCRHGVKSISTMVASINAANIQGYRIPLLEKNLYRRRIISCKGESTVACFQ